MRFDSVILCLFFFFGCQTFCVPLARFLVVGAELWAQSLVRFLDTANTSLLNALELPALAVPMGLSARHGLPVSVQLVAAPGREDLLVAAAVALHAAGVAVSPTPF
jgi:Asp-tRNA(Asn)/Glu-tRNA(Gln) amidotransferase A subunit family amidase